MVIGTWLPSIRAAIAEEMMKYAFHQKEISSLFWNYISRQSLQYLSKERGYTVKFRWRSKYPISQLADDLADKICNPVEKICEICRML